MKKRWMNQPHSKMLGTFLVFFIAVSNVLWAEGTEEVAKKKSVLSETPKAIVIPSSRGKIVETSPVPEKTQSEMYSGPVAANPKKVNTFAAARESMMEHFKDESSKVSKSLQNTTWTLPQANSPKTAAKQSSSKTSKSAE